MLQATFNLGPKMNDLKFNYEKWSGWLQMALNRHLHQKISHDLFLSGSLLEMMKSPQAGNSPELSFGTPF